MSRWTILCATLFFTLAFILREVHNCNEAVCGSIVSKCLLTQSCKCDFQKDCSCCKDCAYCLSYLYNECCSCVDMCPKPNDTKRNLSEQSQVEDIQSKISGLFNALTETTDQQKRWTSFVFPVDFNILLAPKSDIKYQLQSVEQEVVPLKPNITTLNCTVAYITQCMSWEKCRSYCESMGASSLRWFHDGCCECVGDYCINYGINESRCLNCTRDIASEEDDQIPEEEKDFGEDEDMDYGMEEEETN